MKTCTNHISSLIKRCCKGDEKAKFEIFNQYVNQMYNTANRFFNNRMVAEDIVQESFISAFDNIDNFKGSSSFGSWLKRIVINKCITEVRKSKISFEEINSFADYDNDYIESTVSVEEIHLAIKDLPPNARTILNLYVFEDYKHKEIAEMLNITESTSKTQYKRAKQLLHSALKPAYYGT